MKRDRSSRRRCAWPGLGVVLLLVAGMLVTIGAALPAPDAAAAAIGIGTIQAKVSDHRGVNNGTTGNCITYSPVGTGQASALVTSPNQALTAHGRPQSQTSSCPSTLSTATQSAVGFTPSTVTAATDAVPFLIGRMVHYNNPVYADDRYFTGKLAAQLGGFNAPNAVTFDWQLDETPNSGGNNCCDDVISFTTQISDITLTQGGQTYRLVILGFEKVGNTAACPAAPGPNTANEFLTKENSQTHACLYASLVQTRKLTVIKRVTGATPPVKNFGFSSTSTLAGSPWAGGAFTLAAGASTTREIVRSETVGVTEQDPADDRWALTSLTCTQIGAGGAAEPLPGASYDLQARRMTVANVPPPPRNDQPDITCTFTNTYTPKATLTLVKTVAGGPAAPADWTLTATRQGGQPKVSGRSGTPEVTAQRVPTGSWALSEAGSGAGESGYVRGPWSCRTTAGEVPVTDDSVVLADSAQGNAAAAVTCTVNNTFATGSLRISKLVSDPNSGYTGGTAKTFSGSYSCGPGFSGTFNTLTTASPVFISGLPVGVSCTVTETPPIGGLANASFAWGAASISGLPAVIARDQAATVTITNPVVQNTGSFAVGKVVDGPGGYVGGSARVFPVAYSCTLTGGPTSSGTLDVTTGGAISPADPIPTGSVCTFSETLTEQVGDFAGNDPSYSWTGSAVNPTTITIGVNAVAAVTVTNTYTRSFGSLTVAKTVSGAGYLGGADPNFTVKYNCGAGITGSLTVADGGSATKNGLPAGVTCAVSEVPPAADLLDAAHAWGPPSWSPATFAIIAAGSSTTLTVTNPTIPIFGRVSVTKVLAGATGGLLAGSTFSVGIDCGAAYSATVDLAPTEVAGTPDLPVGTSCTVTEERPTGDQLLDGSYGWGPTPGPQTVTVTASGQVVPVTVTNTIIRNRGTLTVAKALVDPNGVVDPARTFSIGYSCVYGGDDPMAGSVDIAAGGDAMVPDVLIGSVCTVTEDPATLLPPPSATDPSYVWLAETYDPDVPVVLTGDAPDARVTVTNTVSRLLSSFGVSKTVTGTGKADGYTGAAFDFDWSCSWPNGSDSGSFALADGESFPDSGSTAPTVPGGADCTLTEGDYPSTAPDFSWSGPAFLITRVPESGRTDDRSVTFRIPLTPGGPVEIGVTNTITRALGSVTVSKVVTGATEGLDPAAPPFDMSLNCGDAGTFELAVPAGGSATRTGIPIGTDCIVSEATPTGGLVDASFAWGETSIDPASVTITGAEQTVTVTNEITRVLLPVALRKTVDAPQGVLDPDLSFAGTWSCEYAGVPVADGTWTRIAGAEAEIAASVPATSTCTATEDPLPTPSPDPSYRWADPVITSTTVSAGGENAVMVANSLARDTGSVHVTKMVTGATAGYTGGTEANFTGRGVCSVTDQPMVPPIQVAAAIADGERISFVDVPVGWTCEVQEDSPGQDLLADASYAWGTSTVTPATFTVMSKQTPVEIAVDNPIVRVNGQLQIVKTVADPDGVIRPGISFGGSYSCVYGDDAPVTGDWTISGATGGTFTTPEGQLLIGSVCTVTENPLRADDLTSPSWAWNDPVIGDDVTVTGGAPASLTVANSVRQLWGGLRITKTLVDPEGGVLPGTSFQASWQCILGDRSWSDRFTVGANASVTAFSPADQLVPAMATCTVEEDTPGSGGLVDGSFGWEPPTYSPDSVVLTADEESTLGVRNTVIRVYGALRITKTVTGPAAGLVDNARVFTGSVVCRYRRDMPLVSAWSATTAAPAVIPGLLVGSSCAVSEDPAGAGGEPVAGDPSFQWLAEIVGDPATVARPEDPTASVAVTNPTQRVFGAFTVTKTISGATDGIADPSTAQYPMTWSCRPANGAPLTGTLTVAAGETWSLPAAVELPANSECTVTEPADSLPALRDPAFSWGAPTFQVDGLDAPGADRAVTFTVPGPQENQQDTITAVAVDNPVAQAFGSLTVSKSSDPPSGSTVLPGSTITYTLTVNSAGQVPVHGVLVTDDLADVVPWATVDPGSIAPGVGTAEVGPHGTQLIWTVGDLGAATSSTLTYRVRVNPGAVDATIRNAVTATGDGGAAVCTATPPAAGSTAAAVAAPADCATEHRTPLPATVAKDVLGTPAINPATGQATVLYRVTVTNPNAGTAIPYTLADALGFPAALTVDSATVTSAPAGVTPADPAWDGQGNTLVVQGATLPAGGTHVYLMVVVATVPAGTGAGDLTCDAGVGPGRGLFNGVTIESVEPSAARGQATACAALTPVPPVPPTPPAPPTPPLPPTPPVPPYPPLPDTGFALAAHLEWALVLLAAGAALVLVGRRRPAAR